MAFPSQGFPSTVRRPGTQDYPRQVDYSVCLEQHRDARMESGPGGLLLLIPGRQGNGVLRHHVRDSINHGKGQGTPVTDEGSFHRFF